MSDVYVNAVLKETEKTISKEFVKTNNPFEASHVVFYGINEFYEIKKISKDFSNNYLSVVILDKEKNQTYEYNSMFLEKDLEFYKEVFVEIENPPIITLEMDELTAKIVYSLVGSCNTINQENTNRVYYELKKLFGKNTTELGIYPSQFPESKKLNITINFGETL